ncbi:hypothetical protein AAFF_G00334220 [Aldrovandia affinis]|uniref:Uncharacterized protein n=1 Tax=Aldrovandia affinis TaxID=143900 RepID=A0AAD7W0E6_9TELE|nr:hypothetical protein AAFF_G00334220 [Aldrovandia affinis]
MRMCGLLPIKTVYDGVTGMTLRRERVVVQALRKFLQQTAQFQRPLSSEVYQDTSCTTWGRGLLSEEPAAAALGRARGLPPLTDEPGFAHARGPPVPGPPPGPGPAPYGRGAPRPASDHPPVGFARVLAPLPGEECGLGRARGLFLSATVEPTVGPAVGMPPLSQVPSLRQAGGAQVPSLRQAGGAQVPPGRPARTDLPVSDMPGLQEEEVAHVKQVGSPAPSLSLVSMFRGMGIEPAKTSSRGRAPRALGGVRTETQSRRQTQPLPETGVEKSWDVEVSWDRRWPLGVARHHP